MNNTTKPTSDTAVLKRYFGLKPGQTNLEFLTELKQLTQTERHELARLAAAELNSTPAAA